VGIEPKLSNRPRPAPNVATAPDDGRVLVDNEQVLVREYVWSPGMPVRQASQGVSTVMIALESGEIADSRQGGNPRPEAVVFGDVALASGNLSRVTVATRGTPRVIVVTLR
jgi:hypothetical protein